MKTILLLAVMAPMASCRTTGSESENETPRRVTTFDASADAEAVATFGTVMKSESFSLVVELPARTKNLPDAGAPSDSAIIDECIDFLDDNFEIGYAKCKDSETQIPLLAKHFTQTCDIKDVPALGAKENFELPCDEAQLFKYDFNPDIAASVE